MTTKPKKIINNTMTRQKTLCMVMIFKLAYLSFLLSTRLTGSFAPIIFILLSGVFNTRHPLFFCSRITA